MSEVITAAGYIRVSSAEQALKGLSIETQIAEIENHAKAHNMKLVGIYIDRGITARKSLHKRIDFMRMMEDVESGKIKHILVLRLDRFFRNIYDYHRMMNEYLIPNKCDWSAVKEQYSTATTNGRLMINLRLSIAEQECDTDSDRIKDVQKHRVAEGYIISGGGVALGMKVENKRMVKDENTNHIAKEIYDHFELHGSVRGTMYYINQKHDLKLIYATVKRILRNPIYKGQYRDNANFCDPTVTVEQWNKVQLMMQSNIKDRGKPQVYIFTGLLKCSHCGKSIAGNCTVKGGKVYKYYRCPMRTINRSCDNLENCNEKIIEDYLISNIEELCKNHVVQVELKQKQKKAVKSNRKQIEAKLQKLNDLYINDFISMEKYKEDYAKLQSQIIEPEETPQTDFTALKQLLEGSFKAKYEMLSDGQKRALWRTVIKEIRMFGKTVETVEFL
jgi:DNA invertase Pin-like site-specific DNA recombinase